MSSANVLPLAPEYEGALTQRLCPQVSDQPNSFRLNKINDILTTLNNEVEHYQLVAKKYKRAKTFVHYTAVGSGAVSGVLSACSIGALFTVVGSAASIPLAAASALFGAGASSLAVFGKKFEAKIEKNREITTLAAAKQETVNRLVSKALIDQKIDDSEFQIILDEEAHYKDLKQLARSKHAKKVAQTPLNVDEIRK